MAAMRTWRFRDVGCSGAGVFADLAQGVADSYAESAGVRGREVGDEAGSGLADLFDGEDHAGLTVVVVITDRHRPREVLDVLIARRELVEGKGVVIDGASHGTIRP